MTFSAAFRCVGKSRLRSHKPETLHEAQRESSRRTTCVAHVETSAPHINKRRFPCVRFHAGGLAHRARVRVCVRTAPPSLRSELLCRPSRGLNADGRSAIRIHGARSCVWAPHENNSVTRAHGGGLLHHSHVLCVTLHSVVAGNL